MESVKAPTVQEVMGKKMPEKKFRASPVSATIWGNEAERDGKKTKFFTVSLDRSYKDKADQWQNTHNLRVSDLPKAMLVLGKAYEYLALVDIETIEEI